MIYFCHTQLAWDLCLLSWWLWMEAKVTHEWCNSVSYPIINVPLELKEETCSIPRGLFIILHQDFPETMRSFFLISIFISWAVRTHSMHKALGVTHTTHTHTQIGRREWVYLRAGHGMTDQGWTPLIPALQSWSKFQGSLVYIVRWSSTNTRTNKSLKLTLSKCNRTCTLYFKTIFRFFFKNCFFSRPMSKTD